jgi:hypothetical protein
MTVEQMKIVNHQSHRMYQDGLDTHQTPHTSRGFMLPVPLVSPFNKAKLPYPA